LKKAIITAGNYVLEEEYFKININYFIGFDKE